MDSNTLLLGVVLILLAVVIFKGDFSARFQTERWSASLDAKEKTQRPKRKSLPPKKLEDGEHPEP